MERVEEWAERDNQAKRQEDRVGVAANEGHQAVQRIRKLRRKGWVTEWTDQVKGLKAEEGQAHHLRDYWMISSYLKIIFIDPSRFCVIEKAVGRIKMVEAE